MYRNGSFDVEESHKVGSVTETNQTGKDGRNNDPADIHLSACQERPCPVGTTPMMVLVIRRSSNHERVQVE